MLKAFFRKITPSQVLIFGLFVASAFLVFMPTAYAGDCDLAGFDLLKCLAGGAGKIFATVFFFAAWLFGVVLGWMGSLFNFAMLVTVFRFAEFFGNSEGLRLAWGILRDIANIVLLFGFIFIGIMTILDIGNFTAKKALPTLIIFAVLLNFSLFVSEAMVDVANAVASSIYEQAGNSDCRDITSETAEEDCANIGLAVHILSTAGITNIWSDGVGDIWNAENDGIQEAGIWFSILMFYIVLVGLFFAASVMLVARAVTLTILFVMSPLGFAGMAIPPLHGYAEEWWKRLVNNILFAPVMVLLILISLKIMQGVRSAYFAGFEDSPDEPLVQVLRDSDMNIGGIFLLFALMIAFLWLSLDSAKKFGIFGASAVVDGTKRWIGNTAGGFSVYPFGRAVRALGTGYDRAARGLRRVPVLSTLAPVVQGLGGAAIDDAIRGTLKTGTDLKIPGTGMDSLSDLEARRKKAKDDALAADKAGREARQKKDNRKALDSALTSLKSARTDDERKAATDGIKVALADMSSEEIRDVISKDSGKAAQIATVMSASEFNKMQEDLSLTQSTRDNMKKARETKMRNDFDAAVTAGGDKLQKFAKDTDVTDLKRLVENGAIPEADLEKMARAMSVSKFKAFNDEKAINSVTRARVRKARYKELNRLVDVATNNANPAAARTAREALHKEKSEDIELSGIMTDDSPAGRTQRAKLIRAMSNAQYEDAKKFDLGTEAVNTMEKMRNDPTNTDSRYHPNHIQHTMETLAEKPEERAKIPPEIWASPDTLPHITLPDLFIIQKAVNQRDSKFTPAQRAAIINHVQAEMGTLGSPLEDAARTHVASIVGQKMQREWDTLKSFYGLP